MPRFLDVLSISPLADGRGWRSNSPWFRYSTMLRGKPFTVMVPQGFTTDLASIPRALWAEFPPWDLYGSGAVIHDALYWQQITTREEADGILREAMDLLAVPAPTIAVIYNAVRIFGGTAWDDNARLRASGGDRVAPMSGLPPYAAPVALPAAAQPT